MSDYDALLAAVIADPRDDTVRLVMADWYDENGDPDRAEFIRKQIEYERLSPNDARREILKERTDELLQAHRDKWVKPIADLGRENQYLRFRRGFIEEDISLSNSVGKNLIKEITKLAPITKIVISERIGLEKIIDLFSDLTQIRFEIEVAPDKLQSIFNNKNQVKNLEELRLGNMQTGLYHKGHLILEEAPFLSSLIGLDVSNCAGQSEQGSPLIEDIAELKIPKLKDLNLGFLALNDQDIADFTKKLKFNLSELTVHGNEAITNESIRAIAKSRKYINLEKLNLGGTGITGEGLDIISRSSNLKNIKSLGLQSIPLNDAKVLETVKKMPSLKEIFWTSEIPDSNERKEVETILAGRTGRKR